MLKHALHDLRLQLFEEMVEQDISPTLEADPRRRIDMDEAKERLTQEKWMTCKTFLVGELGIR